MVLRPRYSISSFVRKSIPKLVWVFQYISLELTSISQLFTHIRGQNIFCSSLKTFKAIVAYLGLHKFTYPQSSLSVVSASKNVCYGNSGSYCYGFLCARWGKYLENWRHCYDPRCHCYMIWRQWGKNCGEIFQTSIVNTKVLAVEVYSPFSRLILLNWIYWIR